jgi:hypothetical protein
MPHLTVIPSHTTHPDSAITAASCQMPAAGLYAEPYALVGARGAPAHAVQHLPSSTHIPAVNLVILACTGVQEIAIWRKGYLQQAGTQR